MAKLENIVKEVNSYLELADGLKDVTNNQKTEVVKVLSAYVNDAVKKRNPDAPPLPADFTPDEIAKLAKTFISEDNSKSVYDGFKGEFLPGFYKTVSKNFKSKGLLELIISPLEETSEKFGVKGKLEKSVEKSYISLNKEVEKFSSDKTKLTEEDVKKRAEAYVTSLKIKDPKINEWFKKRLIDKRNSKEMKAFYAVYANSDIEKLVGANSDKFKDYSLSMTDSIGTAPGKSDEEKMRTYIGMYQAMNGRYNQIMESAKKNMAEA